MIPHDELVAEIIAVAGGEIVGRIRLQKIIYLLDQKGLQANASFHYHHYGPYSRIVDVAVEKAKVFQGVNEVVNYRKSDGAPFSVFKTNADRPLPEKLGTIRQADARSMLKKLIAHTSTILELAATIHWLAFAEKSPNWHTDLVRRKGAKTQDGRAEEALALLRELDIAPA